MAPEGAIATRATQGPTGIAARSTVTSRVNRAPGRSVPVSRLSRSQRAAVAARQTTAVPPLLVRVTTVRPPTSWALTSRRAGAGAQGDGGPVQGPAQPGGAGA